MEDKLSSLIARLEKTVERLESVSSTTSSPTKTSSSTPSTSSSQQSNTQFAPLEALYKDWSDKATATELPGVVDMTNVTLSVYRNFNRIAAGAGNFKKPSPDQTKKIVEYVNSKVKYVDQTYAFPRVHEFHGKMLKDGLGSVAWIFGNSPLEHLDGVIEPVQYNGNKVKGLKKEKETAWVDSYYALLRGTKEFLKENFLTGVIWKGQDEKALDTLIAEFSGSSAPTQTSNTTTAKPTTTSTPTPQQTQSKPEENKDERPKNPMMKNLFAEINKKGEDITKDLAKTEKKKKGEADTRPPLEERQKRGTGVTKSSREVKPTQPPKLEENDNWFVENYLDDQNVHIATAGKTQLVNVTLCYNTRITVDNKIKGMQINNCHRTVIVVDSTISSIEVVDSSNLHIQVKGKVPTIIIDKSDYIKVYLSKELETEIVSSKVTELNITHLLEDGDWAKESPVTEQFTTKWDPQTGKFVTKPLELFMA